MLMEMVANRPAPFDARSLILPHTITRECLQIIFHSIQSKPVVGVGGWVCGVGCGGRIAVVAKQVDGYILIITYVIF